MKSIDLLDRRYIHTSTTINNDVYYMTWRNTAGIDRHGHLGGGDTGPDRRWSSLHGFFGSAGLIFRSASHSYTFSPFKNDKQSRLEDERITFHASLLMTIASSLPPRIRYFSISRAPSHARLSAALHGACRAAAAAVGRPRTL